MDVVRHFEAVPRTAIKDIVACDRPVENEESVKIATKMGPKIPLLNSSTLAAASPLFAGVSAALSQGGSIKDMIANAARGAAGSFMTGVGPVMAGMMANEVLPGTGGVVSSLMKNLGSKT